MAYGYRDIVYFLLKVHRHCRLMNKGTFNINASDLELLLRLFLMAFGNPPDCHSIADHKDGNHCTCHYPAKTRHIEKVSHILSSPKFKYYAIAFLVYEALSGR